jgi:hypothetical protein
VTALDTPALTFEPVTPTPVEDGVLYAVTGPVPVLAHIQLTDGDDRVRGVSPQFRQANKLSTPGDAEVYELALVGSPAGGTFKIGARSTIEHGTYESTGNIPYDYEDDDVETALEAVVGAGNVTVTDGVIAFGGDSPIKGMSLRVAANNLTGGSSPHPTLTRTTAEAVGLVNLPGGPYYWGPIYVPKNASIVADLVADEDGTAGDESDVYEGDSLLAAPVTVYDYGDL